MEFAYKSIESLDRPADEDISRQYETPILKHFYTEVSSIVLQNLVRKAEIKVCDDNTSSSLTKINVLHVLSIWNNIKLRNCKRGENKSLLIAIRDKQLIEDYLNKEN